MKKKMEDVAVTEFYDLLHSGCSIEDLVKGVFNSPKHARFDQFLRTIIEEEKAVRDLGFKLKLFIEWDDDDYYTDKTGSDG